MGRRGAPRRGGLDGAEQLVRHGVVVLGAQALQRVAVQALVEQLRE
jgi:hypothetical protein